MLQQTLSKYKIENNEYAYLLEPTMYNNISFKCSIPKLMPFIPRDNPRELTKGFNTGILINSSDTKPHIRTSIKTVNYMEIDRLSFADLSQMGNWNGGSFVGVLPTNTKFLCMVVNNDINNIHIMDIVR